MKEGWEMRRLLGVRGACAVRKGEIPACQHADIDYPVKKAIFIMQRGKVMLAQCLSKPEGCRDKSRCILSVVVGGKAAWWAQTQERGQV